MSNKLLIIVGSSGSGKSTLTKEILGEDKKIITVTTRPIRDGEENNKDYIFMEEEEFLNRQEKGEFLESIKYVGNYYGTLKENLENIQGIKYIITDFNGYKYIKNNFKEDCVGIYIEADKDKLFESMFNRGDKLEDINKRMLLYKAEISNKKHFKTVFRNDFSEDSLNRFKELVNSIAEGSV